MRECALHDAVRLLASLVRFGGCAGIGEVDDVGRNLNGKTSLASHYGHVSVHL